MNNSFESIRKLALSKLSQFKFIMTIVMYLATVIPLLSLGYLMGRTSNDKWLLDLSSLLGSTGSLLGGLATVFTAWVAFGAYGAWKKQITHPEMFQKDMKIMEELAEIHEFHRWLMWVLGRDIASCLNEYQSDTGCSDIQKFNKEISNLKWRVDELYRINSSLFNEYLADNVISVLDNNESFNYKIRKEINEYLTLCEDIKNAMDESFSYEYSDKTVCNYMVYSCYFLMEINIISAVDRNGKYDMELDFKFNSIKNKYSERWGL